MRKENGPAVADEFVEVNLAVRGLGREVGGFGAKTETGLYGGERGGGAGKTTDGGPRDGTGAKWERSTHNGFGEEESRGEATERGDEGTHYE